MEKGKCVTQSQLCEQVLIVICYKKLYTNLQVSQVGSILDAKLYKLLKLFDYKEK